MSSSGVDVPFRKFEYCGIIDFMDLTDLMDFMDLMDLMDFMDFMDLISAFHMDLDWIWIGFGFMNLLKMDYGLDLDYDFKPSGPTGCGSIKMCKFHIRKFSSIKGFSLLFPMSRNVQFLGKNHLVTLCICLKHFQSSTLDGDL